MSRRPPEIVEVLCWRIAFAVLFVTWTVNISMASGLASQISTIKSDVLTEVARHPAINGKEFILEWRDFPPRLPSCMQPVTTSLLFYPPDRANRPSRITLKLECSETPRWTRNIRAQISYRTELVVLSAQVSRGGRFDERLVRGLPSGALPDLTPFEGRVARRDLEAGSELQLNDWEPTTVIRRGARVSVSLSGVGFQIETEGEALGDASLNDKVQVRLSNGTRVDGIVVGENRVVVERI